MKGPPRHSDYAAIILAAGHSTRFGSNKLLAKINGIALIEHAVQTALAAPVKTVTVLTQPDFPLTLSPPHRANVQHMELNSGSLSETLQAGISSLSADIAGTFIFLGDMPCIPPDLAHQLAQHIGENYAAYPTYQGQNGHPVLLSARAFPDIALLQGDSGASRLLRNRSDVLRLPVDTPQIGYDIDRPQDLLTIAPSR